MANVYDADQTELVNKTAEELKKIDVIKAPEWAQFVKTGVHKEKAPTDAGWWYVRAASVLRRVYKMGPIGVSKLRTKYGGKKNRGVRPEKFFKASGNILRKVLQQLEKAELVKNDLKSKRKGRVITPKGISFLDKIATEISKNTVKVKTQKEEKKVEKKTEQEKAQTKDEKKQDVSPKKVEEKFEPKKGSKEPAKAEK